MKTTKKVLQMFLQTLKDVVHNLVLVQEIFDGTRWEGV